MALMLFMIELLQRTQVLMNNRDRAQSYTSLDTALADESPSTPVSRLHNIGTRSDDLSVVQSPSALELTGAVSSETISETMNSTVTNSEECTTPATPTITPFATLQVETPNSSSASYTTIRSDTSSKLLSEGPDLHTMAKFFLNRPMRIIFEAAALLHFTSFLISYGLAGPIAYAQLFNISDKFMYLISPFVVVCTLIVILGHHFMQYIITVSTLIKGVILVVMVLLVGYVAKQVNIHSRDTWQYIGRPFLIGTVALGGAMNNLPVIYSKMKPSKRNIFVIQVSSCLALFACYALNVLWCYFVLHVVPQHGEANSLDSAKKLGQISTVPVINIIQETMPQFTWMAKLVSAFVTLSVTVSFVTTSSGLKHMLDGFVKSFHAWQVSAAAGTSRTLQYLLWFKKPFDRISKRNVDQVKFLDYGVQMTLYVVTFGLVLVFAQVNYQEFFLFLEVFSSFALNLNSGFFVAYMLFQSRRLTGSNTYQIPVALPSWFVMPVVWLVASYFLFAVGYDIVYTALRILIGQSRLPF